MMLLQLFGAPVGIAGAQHCCDCAGAAGVIITALLSSKLYPLSLGVGSGARLTWVFTKSVIVNSACDYSIQLGTVARVSEAA